MSLTPKENNLALTKFESMLRTNSVYFFDAVEFEEIIQYYIDSGKNSLAKKALQLGLKQHPKVIILRLLEAEILIFEDKLEKASILLKDIQAIEPTNSEVYVQQANIFSKRDNHIEAINLLKKALIYTDDEADILAMIGMEYLFLDNFDEARLNFAKCLEVDFEDYSSLYNVIYCYDMENKHEDAIKYLEDYINKDPYSEVAWHQLGRQYYILENYEKALWAFDYAVIIDDFFVGAYLEKAKSLEKLGRYEEAIQNYEVSLELDDPTAFVFLRIGKCYQKLKENKLAVDFYQKAVHEDPLLDKGWMAITNIYAKSKDFDKALYYINKAIEIDNENTLYWRKYASISTELGLFDEAALAFEKCLLLQDFDLEIWLGVTDSLCALKEFDQALSYLVQAKKYFKNFAEIEYRLVGLTYIFGNEKKAVQHLNKALKIDRHSTEILQSIFPEVYSSSVIQKALKHYK